MSNTKGVDDDLSLISSDKSSVMVPPMNGSSQPSAVADPEKTSTGEELVMKDVTVSHYDLDGPTQNNKESEPTESADSSSSFPTPVGDITCWKHTNSFSSFFTLTWGWLLLNKSQILSGITVALAQVPEAVSFSFVAGVDPIVGLQSAWIMGICTSLGGGRPGMVAGATGAVAVVLPKLVQDHGVGYMFYAIMLAGILQIIFGFLRLGVLVGSR